jgi:hypothetical protein
MTFFIVASILAIAALSLWLYRLVNHDGSETVRAHPPRSHQVDVFGHVPSDLR